MVRQTTIVRQRVPVLSNHEARLCGPDVVPHMAAMEAPHKIESAQGSPAPLAKQMPSCSCAQCQMVLLLLLSLHAPIGSWQASHCAVACNIRHHVQAWKPVDKRASMCHLQPSKPTWSPSQDIHSQRSRFTNGWAWSMLGAAPKQSPDAGPPAWRVST